MSHRLHKNSLFQLTLNWVPMLRREAAKVGRTARLNISEVTNFYTFEDIAQFLQ